MEAKAAASVERELDIVRLKAPGASVRDMAQRAKAAVMSLSIRLTSTPRESPRTKK